MGSDQENHMKIKMNNRLVKLFILGFWLLLIFVLICTGKLGIFIRKTYIPFSLVTLIILAGLIISVLKDEHESLHPPDWRALTFFLFPVLLFALVRPDTLSTFAIAKRGVVSDVNISDAELGDLLKARVDQEGRYRALTLKQVLALSGKEPAKTNGMEVSTEGLVFKNGPSSGFTLVRFLMFCCAADATPLGIPVVWEKSADFKQDAWVRVNGKLVFGPDGVKLTVEEVTVLPAPSDPYLY